MSGVDDYERQYMGGGGILYQTKAKAPWFFHLLLLMPALLSSVIITLSAILDPKAPSWILLMILPSVLVTFPLWMLFAVLRATVTTTHVHIQYGLFGPKIPLENIQSCEGVAYNWTQYGGFGIRRARDGSWAYNMMGDQGKAVKLTWTDEKGRSTTTLVSAANPDAFVEAVNKAKSKARSPMRVPAERAAAKGLTPEQVREAEAELEAEFPSGEEGAQKTKEAG
jgi:hypothetical protein